MEQSINQLIDICKHQRENGGGSDMNKGNQQQILIIYVKYLYWIPWEQKKKAEKHLAEDHCEQKKEYGLFWERNQEKDGWPVTSEQNNSNNNNSFISFWAIIQIEIGTWNMQNIFVKIDWNNI